MPETQAPIPYNKFVKILRSRRPILSKQKKAIIALAEKVPAQARIGFDSQAFQRRVGDEHARNLGHWLALTGHSDPKLFDLCPKDLCTDDKGLDPCQIAVQSGNFTFASQAFDANKVYQLHRHPLTLALAKLLGPQAKAAEKFISQLDPGLNRKPGDYISGIFAELFSQAPGKLIKLLPAVSKIAALYPEALEHVAGQTMDLGIPVNVYQALVTALAKYKPQSLADCGVALNKAICGFKAEHAVILINALAKVSPETLTAPNGQNKAPLEVAIEKHETVVALALIKTLAKTNPAALTAPNQEDSSPLEAAMGTKQETLAESLITTLAKVNPEALTAPNQNGMTPLEAAIVAKQTTIAESLITTLAKINPAALTTKYERANCTPLEQSLALGFSQVSLLLIDIFAKTNPQVLVTPDNDGNLPIAQAFKYWRSNKVMSALLENTPVTKIQIPQQEESLLRTRSGDLSAKARKVLAQLVKGIPA